LKPPLRFLWSNADPETWRSALVVQTGGPGLLTRAVGDLAAKYPAMNLTVLLQRNMRERVPARPGVEYIDNEGPKPDFVRRLRAREFDVAFVLYTNDAGYWKLKLLPFLIDAGTVIAIKENLDWFPLNLRNTDALAAHLRWRMESSVTFSPGGVRRIPGALAKAAFYPAVLAYLLAFERARNLRARINGSAPTWKDENRPDTRGRP